MYRLFKVPEVVAQSTLSNPNWNYVRQGLRSNLQTIHRFYRNNATSVKSDHFLMKLLNHFGSAREQSLSSFYVQVQSAALDLAMALKMTSANYTGTSFPGYFYGPGVQEILIAYNDSFNYDQAYANWEDVEAVTVLAHPCSDLSLPILDGVNRADVAGYAVIAINIPLLLVQYRAFRDREWRLKGQTDQRSSMQFIRMHVLPNMLASHLDYALFKRIYRTHFTEPQTKFVQAHPFYLTDYTARVDAMQQEQLMWLLTRNYKFAEILKTIPMVVAPTALEMAGLPVMPATRQVNWALSLSRLDVLELLFSVSEQSPGNQNQMEINTVKRFIQMYRTDQALSQGLPGSIATTIQSRYDRLMK